MTRVNLNSSVVETVMEQVGRDAQVELSSSSAPTAAESSIVTLTAGNIRHNHIYLRTALHLFPDNSVGGSNRAVTAPGTVKVEFEPGPTAETDIAGDEKILRERGAVSAFFAFAGAVAGDRICIERLSERRFRFRLLKDPA